jgi:hypothetical protein
MRAQPSGLPAQLSVDSEHCSGERGGSEAEGDVNACHVSEEGFGLLEARVVRELVSGMRAERLEWCIRNGPEEQRLIQRWFLSKSFGGSHL